jgi:hypothetical protein
MGRDPAAAAGDAPQLEHRVDRVIKRRDVLVAVRPGRDAWTAAQRPGPAPPRNGGAGRAPAEP